MERALAMAVDLFWRLGARSLLPKRSEPLSEDSQPQQIVERINLIRTLLRRFPFWIQGHQRLAEMSLSVGDVGTAYAAAQCVVAGSHQGSSPRGEGYLLLGRSFLQRGDWRSSLTYLERANELIPKDPRIAEECAAAYMAGAEPAQALKTLEAIQSEHLSPSGRAALDFLRQTSQSAL
jgi:tetratricopeptide (TPR) repeat protein